MDDLTWSSLQEKLRPGMELYHRARHIRDLVHTFGTVRLLSFDEDNLWCQTREGDKQFKIAELNRHIFFDKGDIQRPSVIGEDHEMSEQERDAFKPVDPNIFYEERTMYDRVKGYISARIQQIKDRREKIAQEFNDYSETSDAHAAVRQSNILEEEERLESMWRKPYFARIKLSKHSLTDFYISEQDPDIPSPRIINWRNPICGLYYTANPVERERYGLQLLRKLEIYGGELVGYHDAYSTERKQDADDSKSGGIIDEFLLRVLERRRESKDSRNIIQTIQDRQYQLISLPSGHHVEVQGCAGSGKTMILLHRIAWLMHNHPGMKPENILIITPNRHLNMDLEALSARLQLSRIPRCTIAEAYHRLIHAGMDEYGLTESPMGDADSPSLRNDYDPVLSPNLWDKVYGDKVMEQFRSYRESKRDLTELIRLSGCISEHRVSGKTRREFVTDFRRSTKTLAQCMADLSKLFSGFNCSDIVVLRSRIRQRINDRTQEIQSIFARYRRDIQVSAIQDALRRSQPLSELIRIRSAGNPVHISLNDEDYRRLQTLYRDLQVFDSNEQALDSLVSRLELYFKSKVMPRIGRQAADFARFSIPRNADRRAADWLISTYMDMCRRIEAIDAFEKGEDQSYLCVIWSLFREDWKRKLGLDPGKTGLYEWYQSLRFMLSHFGLPTVHVTHLMIDEAQDYARCEVNLLIKALENPVINSYGDVEQRIRNIPAPYFFPEENLSEANRFVLDVNYRNAEEITLKTNERCGISMRPLGLRGTVEFVAERNLAVSMAVVKDDDGCVLIVKNADALALAIQAWSRYIVRPDVNENGVEYPDDRIPLLTIEEVKGMEFRHAYVWDKEMMARERYIAYTRAQEKLTVVV